MVRTYSGKVTVNKNVSGNLAGAMAEGIDPVIHIKGDLASGNNGAIIMTTSGSIIIDGEIKEPAQNPAPLSAMFQLAQPTWQRKMAFLTRNQAT